MNKRMIAWIAALTLLVAGCGAPKPNLATNPEDIVGTWFLIGIPGPGFHVQFQEDGAVHGATARDYVESHPVMKGRFWFEGTRLFVEDTLGVCSEDSAGSYEVHLLESGNLRFVNIEDECMSRVSLYQGQEKREGLIEFEPVP